MNKSKTRKDRLPNEDVLAGYILLKRLCISMREYHILDDKQ